MSRAKDITSQRFGRLTVVGRAENSANGKALWHCRCDCGKTTISNGTDLRNGSAQSCGCSRTKPHRQSAEYMIFHGAKQRCQNPSNTSYLKYGGRGIEFRFVSFEEFYEELGPRPSPKHSVDRINNDGHYEKGNVRWATRKQQAYNKRRYGKLICWHKPTKKWQVSATVGGQNVYVGLFDEYTDAVVEARILKSAATVAAQRLAA